jgi:hypothetical protein
MLGSGSALGTSDETESKKEPIGLISPAAAVAAVAATLAAAVERQQEGFSNSTRQTAL